MIPFLLIIMPIAIIAAFHIGKTIGCSQGFNNAYHLFFVKHKEKYKEN